ncbi:hypothetical protein BH11GEM2_BH11GEM2_01450 [soil metagenome]
MSTRLWKLAALVLSFAVVPTIARAQAMQSVCKDGTKTATSGKGTCSGHNGVDETATKTFLASGKTVKCSDGAMSAGGRGACSGHGGVGKKGAAAAEKKEMMAEKKADKMEMRDAKADKKEAKKRSMTPKKDAKAPA